MEKTTIEIEGENVLIGEAVEVWENAGICRDCINYRLYMNNKYDDSYNDIALLHCEDCIC